METQKTQLPAKSPDAEMAGEASGDQRHPELAVIGRGSRETYRPIKETLQRYARKLDRVHKDIFTLRANPSLASPWMDWYADNEYLIRRVLRMLRRDLSADFLKYLPVLREGPAAGQPRVQEVARLALERSEQRYDGNVLEALVLEYRDSAPLNTAELWALPLLLRFRALSLIMETAQSRIADLNARDTLQGMVDIHSRDVVADGVWTLHRLERADWKGFFERTSQVGALLRRDPAGAYARMDFESRDRYRTQVEKLARRCNQDELDVARTVLDMAEAGGQASTELLARGALTHVGYYLVGEGRPKLEQQLGYRPDTRVRFNRWLERYNQSLYFSVLSLVAAVLFAVPTVYAWTTGSLWQALLAALIVWIPAGVIASIVVNWLATLLVPPRVLPKLDFTHGIDPQHQAVVCMAVLIAREDDIDGALDQLERHYLANTDRYLRFGLLTGLFDANQQSTERDEALLERLREGINRLNTHYAKRDVEPFFWMHRGRTWNPQDGLWMEWERKRGKLTEFNRFLLTGEMGSFVDGAGEREKLRQVRYVITLDADTILPVGAAKRMVGTIAHPLNYPVWDTETGEVLSGYSILQPRVEINPITATRNIFTRIFSGDRGLDLYTLAVSEAYQDMFGEGIFTGKGLYHVAAFEASLRNAVPEGAVLSHDLFEGIHGRAALVSDVVMYEDYPPEYLAYVRRLHRWVRGDWQLLPWLLPKVPTEDGSTRPNRLDALHRWQLGHNLLRSLQGPWLILLLVAGWLVLPGSALVWTLLGLMALMVPTITGVVGMAHASIRRRRSAEHMRNLKGDLKRWLLAVAFLPQESRVTLDAIVRSLYRNYVSHRKLLEWTPAAMDAGRSLGFTALRYWRAMWIGPALALVVGLGVAAVSPEALIGAAPVLALWLASPQLAFLSRRDRRPPTERIRPEDRTHLRRIARRTWYFFERFVGPEDHWLPPDHFQEDPKGTVAHRTSPTNIGLLFLSNLTAYDMGYIDAQEFLIRCRNTLRSIEKMPRFRGHVLNWVDTHHLTVLPPAYVSTVDSGNLMGSLLTLKQACLDLASEKVWDFAHFEGFLDTVGVLEDSLGDYPATKPQQALAGQLIELRQQVMDVRRRPRQWPALIEELAFRLSTHLDPAVQRVLRETQALPSDVLADMRLWLERAHHHIHRMRQSRDRFLPWWAVLKQAPRIRKGQVSEKCYEDWRELKRQLFQSPTFAELASIESRLLPLVERLSSSAGTSDEDAMMADWLRALPAQLATASAAAEDLIRTANEVCATSERLFADTDMTFLYDSAKQVFRIGYNVDQGQLDDNAYDLLASEARLASLLAIAKGDVPARHWIHLGRPMTQEGDHTVLLSWSGTMFEYLMPQLYMPEPANSLLGQSALGAIANQIRYGERQNIPWGISESGFYLLDGAQNYAYHAFGAPELSLRAEKGPKELVITPYATFLAMLWRPKAAFDNLRRLEELGMLGRYGFFEALDYTERRMDVGQPHAIVKSYMAHHHGMSLVSLGITLGRYNAVSRFASDPRVQSCQLFLQERVTADAELEYPVMAPEEEQKEGSQDAPMIMPWEESPDTPTPHVHLLSNGRLSVLASSRGGGYSGWKDFALTRWRPDSTLEPWGNWLYLQDMDSDDLWSICREPTKRPGLKEQVRFHAHGVEYRRQDESLIQSLEVTVSPWHDVELRRVTITNHGHRSRRLRLTSYAEVVLADPRADAQHPAFSNLFVHSEFLADRSLLLFERRTRDPGAESPVMGELIMGLSGVMMPDAVETSRLSFLGRLGHTSRPAALNYPEALEGNLGYALDPIASLQKTVKIKPGASVQLAFLRIAGDSRADVLNTAERFAYWPRVQRTFEEGRIQVSRDLWRSKVDGNDLRAISLLTSAVLHPHSRLRAPVPVLSANRLRQEHLWGVGISGDFPIVLMRIGRDANVETARSLLKAHEYWRKRNMKVDVVLLNVGDTGYEGTTQDTVRRLLAQTNAEAWVGARGGIFPVTADALSDEEVVLLQTAANVMIDAAMPSLSAALRALDRSDSPLPRLPVRPIHLLRSEDRTPLSRPDNLRYDNGHGGFTPDGREYVIEVGPHHTTPAPWINVIANRDFGFIVSESGSGYSWYRNSGENRLTPWRNDPVLDEPGECLYLRDEETGALWSPTPRPVPHESTYVVSHGAGYSRFLHRRHEVESELKFFTTLEDPVKLVQVTLRNRSGRQRRLTMTYYAEWVLGTRREVTQGFIKPAYLPEHAALIASNPYSPECPEQIAFLASSKPAHGYTTDRNEFLGHNGSLERPAALKRVGLANRVEPGRDPCAALQVHVDLPAEGEETFTFVLGAGETYEQACELLSRYRDSEQVEQVWDAVQGYWDRILGALTLECPDDGIGFLFNRWLLYQSLACRINGRTGLYQSSGAFGFRDQLQDTTALLQTAPEVCRDQILAAAARQFPEGDVLHWWHPPHARGVRTRISDDLVWLPFVVSEYLAATGDEAILDEKVPYLVGEPLKPEEHERYAEYGFHGESGTLYQHCVRVLERANRRGPHGLPLIGGGDWNDGMNRVGVGGKGESVWMAWFLVTTLRRFAPISEKRLDASSAQRFLKRADELATAVNAQAWDGHWFRRAYYDDGSPLGSAGQSACEIDAIAQSWAVISGAADEDRAAQAMGEVGERLVREDPGMVLLFTPPFLGREESDPGYIAAYPPGVRENGGQYTHAACWTGLAFAGLGDNERAAAVLRCLNPINHGNSPETIGQYRVEPYVVAADIYGAEPHTGRGGWTWYTGSAGWLYRFILEGILGFRRDRNQLTINPCLPPEWPGFTLHYRYGESVYRIVVEREGEGEAVPCQVKLVDDGAEHEVRISLERG
ncbi:glucoamylase family protein [Marinobacteraceae bacterium S3BR75-40.1]